MRTEAFCDWDNRPAVLFREPSGEFAALAKLSAETDWKPVDAPDVWATPPVLSSADALVTRFGRRFGFTEVPSPETAMRIRDSGVVEQSG